jgi:hypothetical protein
MIRLDDIKTLLVLSIILVVVMGIVGATGSLAAP